MKVCRHCLIEKDENEFYTNRRICKHCFTNDSYRTELYYCIICNITIRKTCRNVHDKTITHLKSKVSGENNIHRKLGKSCMRSKPDNVRCYNKS